jgi:hypothetical protein
MHKFLILSIHFVFSTVGTIEYCLAKGARRFSYKTGSHYAARLPYDHPAYEGILISLQEIPRQPRCTAHVLSGGARSSALQYHAWTIPLN